MGCGVDRSGSLGGRGSSDKSSSSGVACVQMYPFPKEKSGEEIL